MLYEVITEQGRKDVNGALRRAAQYAQGVQAFLVFRSQMLQAVVGADEGSAMGRQHQHPPRQHTAEFRERLEP